MTKWGRISMAGVVLLLLAYLAGLIGATVAVLKSGLPTWLASFDVLLLCALAGGFGGLTYCLRGVYLSACVRKQWDIEWLPWYFIRPIISVLCGAISYVFLKAGLMVLDAVTKEGSNYFGFYALAYIAGLNVDKFVAKLEGIAHAAWGIERSRMSQEPKGKD